MTDRIKEDEYLKARLFAEKVRQNDLERGISVLSQQPYFSGLMIEAGLNPTSQEHCDLAKQSLEDKLKATGNEMIVRPLEGFTTFGNLNFKRFYSDECWRVQLELIELYKELKSNKRIKSFLKDVLEVEGERSYVSIFYNKNKSLIMRNSDKEEKWNNDGCIHSVADIKISKSWGGIKVQGKTCIHISDNKERDFMEETRRTYSFYFENPTISSDTLSKFDSYFNQFRRFPEALREAFDGNSLIEVKKDLARKIMETK